MFDSIQDANGDEWQTKAFGCGLDVWKIGGRIRGGPPFTYQVEVLGGPRGECIDSFATVREGVIEKVPAKRDKNLPLLDYGGAWSTETEEN